MLTGRTSHILAVAAIATCLLTSSVAPILAAPASARTAAAKSRVDRAMERLEAARRRSAAIDARVARSSAALDEVVAEQRDIHFRLNARSNNMYRSGDTSFLSFLLGASTFKEFTTRWDLLMRMNQQDAEDLRRLDEARAKAERTAGSLLKLQDEQVKAAESVSREVARARKELAASQTQLAEYRARAAASAKRSSTTARKKGSSLQRFRGVGAWKTAVASHYGRNFSGRGASGERIGPYSMIVAHKTLPFGTLVEFEYNGKRAVARVTDRGPHVAGRTFDLGPGVVRVLGFEGVHKVRYRIVKR